ncbi:MAG TPA: GNAT family N-acetyltransferase [Anaerolineae bacterium]|nr:GNAT family N-acetyltransferase [Anaerolineae bacterium]HQI87074.1 GNAT family N-acetyltransferase [Anaerolineae bacterium]
MTLTSRLYETEHDLLDMLDMLMEARAQTSDWRYAHVGEMLFDFFMVVCHLNPQEHIRLWHDGAGKLVGYAMLGEDPAFNWQILPAYEWTGIEDEAWDWANTLVAELRRRDAELWGGPMVSGARQDNAQRIAFLEQHGFRYSGRFAEVNMLRFLDDPIAQSPVPDGFEVRALAETGETAQRAAAERAVWLPWTVGNVSDDDYAYFMRLPGYHRDLDVVAVAPDGIIAAYVNGWIDPVNRIGDFGPVGAVPEYRRRGLTRAALLENLRRMKAHGMERVCVSTGISNTAARNLYESVGFRVVNQYLDYVRAE